MSWRWLALVVLVAACAGDGDDGASPPTVGTGATPTTTGDSAPPGVAPVGFATEAATITAADGSVCEVCLWVAATDEERARGLMGVTDLGGADGMLFVWDGPTTGQFWMRDTPTPLSIAWFAADGSFVSAADMAPCLDGPDSACARYAAAGPYTVALEVFAGGLGAVGIGPGSRIDRSGLPCDPVPP